MAPRPTLFDGSLDPTTVATMVEDMAAITAGIYTHALLPAAYTRLPCPPTAGTPTPGNAYGPPCAGSSQNTAPTPPTTAVGPALANSDSDSDSDISDQVITFFIAGMETTGNALAWAAHHLTQDPAPQRRVRTEATALPSGPLSHTALPHLELTSHVVTEALRHSPPPVWPLTRTTPPSTP